jgi:hypothetical protein
MDGSRLLLCAERLLHHYDSAGGARGAELLLPVLLASCAAHFAALLHTGREHSAVPQDRIIGGLSREMRMKLERVRPPTIGQTLRIPGITHGRSNLYPRGIRLQGARRPAD